MGLLLTPLLIGCATTKVETVQVQAGMFRCDIDVSIPGAKGTKLPDDVVATQLLKERARGNCYKSRLDDVYTYLKSKDAIVGE